MRKEPVCCLCQGKLVKEKNVLFDAFGYSSARLAWVCPDCGAAFPIAVRAKWNFGSGEQLYLDGKRFDAHGGAQQQSK